MGKQEPIQHNISAGEIYEALVVAAELVALDPDFAPIFLRLEDELNQARSIDPIERARRLIAGAL